MLEGVLKKRSFSVVPAKEPAQLTRLQRPDLDVDGIRPDVAVARNGLRLARKVPIDAFALEMLTTCPHQRDERAFAADWLFVATGSGKALRTTRLGNAPAEINVTAAGMSPRLL